MNYLFSGEISRGGWREDSSCRGCGMQFAIRGIFWLVFFSEYSQGINCFIVKERVEGAKSASLESIKSIS